MAGFALPLPPPAAFIDLELLELELELDELDAVPPAPCCPLVCSARAVRAVSRSTPLNHFKCLHVRHSQRMPCWNLNASQEHW